MHPTELELLGIQAEASFDPRGRIIGLYGITIHCSEAGQALWIGADVPRGLASELTATFDRAGPSRHPGEPPAALAPCARLLDTAGRSLRRAAGPSFLITPDTRFASDLHIERSDASNTAALRDANPGNWLPVEWDELLDGRLGPWAIATEGTVVVSICHTPGPPTARAAECGVWTLPGFRGRGYAAAVTAAWAALLRPSGRYLFYSTDADNHSSQGVARRLNLHPLGWIWRLGTPRASEDAGVHPLCSLRQRR